VVSPHPPAQQGFSRRCAEWRYETTILNDGTVEVETTVRRELAEPRQGLPEASRNRPNPHTARRYPTPVQVNSLRRTPQKGRGGRQMFESMRAGALLSSLPDTPKRERITDALNREAANLLQSTRASPFT